MITAFSQGDVNDINQVLSDETFTRKELYIILNALENYNWKRFNQDNLDRCNDIQCIEEKIKNLIQVDLEND